MERNQCINVCIPEGKAQPPRKILQFALTQLIKQKTTNCSPRKKANCEKLYSEAKTREEKQRIIQQNSIEKPQKKIDKNAENMVLQKFKKEFVSSLVSIGLSSEDTKVISFDEMSKVIIKLFQIFC